MDIVRSPQLQESKFESPNSLTSFFIKFLSLSLSLSLYIYIYIYKDNNKQRMKNDYLNKIECRIENLTVSVLKNGCIK